MSNEPKQLQPLAPVLPTAVPWRIAAIDALLVEGSNLECSAAKEDRMSLESEFKSSTMEFLGKYVLIVAADAEADKVSGVSPTAKHFKLKLRQEGGNVVQLETNPMVKAGPDAITAYWLPWRTKSATTLKLGGDAEFFFTSEMTNCRFSILNSDDEAPVVAHIAGTASRDERDALEREMIKEVESKGWTKAKSVMEAKDVKTEGEALKLRRLSISGVPLGLHEYKGQRGTFTDSGSAFVFGKRTDKKWAFYAQICAGNMKPENIAGHGKIPKEIKQLGKLFEFG
ncbi:MAG: hypothetical protein H7Z15_09730 [Rhizobacter sp.]|nr:hypothetical protein [Rhizobacter sp.]